MPRNEHSVTINLPVRDVFDFVGRDFFRNNPKWAPDIQELTRTSTGPMNVGATAHQVRLVNGKPVESEVHITEYEPNRKFSFKSVGPTNAQGSYTFDEAGGGTRLTMVLDMQPEGFGRLAGPIIARKMKESMEADLGRLKTMLESGAAVSG